MTSVPVAQTGTDVLVLDPAPSVFVILHALAPIHTAVGTTAVTEISIIAGGDRVLDRALLDQGVIHQEFAVIEVAAKARGVGAVAEVEAGAGVAPHCVAHCHITIAIAVVTDMEDQDTSRILLTMPCSIRRMTTTEEALLI